MMVESVTPFWIMCSETVRWNVIASLCLFIPRITLDDLYIKDDVVTKHIVCRIPVVFKFQWMLEAIL